MVFFVRLFFFIMKSKYQLISVDEIRTQILYFEDKKLYQIDQLEHYGTFKLYKQKDHK